MQRPLLRGGSGLCPNASRKVQVLPFRAQHLAATSAGQKQQPEGICGLLVGMVGEGCREPRQLVSGQIAVPLALLVSLNPLSRVVRAPAPSNAEVEESGEEGDGSVG